MLQQAQNTYTVAELTLTTAAVIPTKIAVTVRKRKNTCICGRHCKKTTIEGGSEEGREGEREGDRVSEREGREVHACNLRDVIIIYVL